MASKRKSSTPCMIPSKAPRLNEGDQDSPIYLGPSRISEIDRNAAADLGEEREATEAKDGTYTCSGHPDFRADSCFLCLTCGISSAKFEGLALHNARVHPSTLNTSLQLKVKDKRVMVEQTFVNTTEMGKDIEIAISKTPIMRMLKGKSEPKKIVVSHTILDEPESVPASRETDRKDSTTTTVNVSHVPTLVHNSTAKVMPSAIQIVNGSGALPMLKTPITQVSSQSSSITRFIFAFQVMIPLSSIPTYSASMDESSFLKTSFSKFPYPTKAELCYLTVVTKFPEEQIKIWFTAQRLKQGISWSPEEIEEARRKMFNTIIQTAPATSASLNSTAQHTIVLPASLGATGLSQILQGSLVNHGGVIVTQPMMANGIQVSSAPVALAVTPKPQAAARTVGSSSAGRNVISPSNRNGTSSVNSSGQASVINLSLGSSNRAKSNIVNGKHSDVETPNKSKIKERIESTNSKSNSPVVLQNDNTNCKSKDTQGTNIDDVHSSASNSPNIRMEDAASPASKCSSPSPAAPSISGSKTPVNPFLDPSFYKGKKSQEQLGVKALEASFCQSPDPSNEEVDRLRAETKMTRREIHGWFTERRKRMAAEKKRQEEERAMREEEEAEGEEEEVDEEEPKVNPIKINLKMLKVTEAKQEGDASDCKKTPDQLHMLKKIYARTQWPSATQYDELISGTGLPRPEVVRWFGDCRYVQKNGQLKWLEAYQRTVLTEDLEKGNDQALQAHLDTSSFQLPQTTVTTTEAAVPGSESEAQLPGSSSPMEPQPGAGNEEKMEQSVCGVSKDE
uniref:Zinc fingers and homeoboxes 3 n=1 Tax=Neogobius melanostomus TaxID=47308 RepID=A0A8C6TAK5_9GOBI